MPGTSIQLQQTFTMKVLLRNLDNDKLYKNPGLWVALEESPTDFVSPKDAVRFARSLNLPNLEMLILDDDGRPIMGQRLDPPSKDR
jgi:hypothetical protein